jgi:DNA-binding NarL/FixJ family response regulator
MTLPIKIGIVENNKQMLADIQRRISLIKDAQLVFQAENGRDMIRNIDHQNLPDVILMDLDMPVMNGILATRQIKTMFPKIRVLVFTVFDNENKLIDAILAGASGYLLKDCSIEKLKISLFEVAEGGAAFSPSIARKVLEREKSKSEGKETHFRKAYKLTSMQVKVLTELSEGLSPKQIKEKYGVEESTVRKHLEHVYAKLQVSGSRQAIIKFSKEQH